MVDKTAYVSADELGAFGKHIEQNYQQPERESGGTINMHDEGYIPEDDVANSIAEGYS